MKNIISELFYGNIDPQTRGYQKGSYIQKQMTILANAEEVLTENLWRDNKKNFLSYANASNIILGESEFNVSNSAYFDTLIDTLEICSSIAENIGFKIVEIRDARHLKTSPQQRQTVKQLLEGVIVMEK